MNIQSTNPLESKLTIKIHSLQSDFLTLSEFHFKKQIEKALQQTATAPLNMTSISIDDTFYILKKSIERVKSCMNETLLINFIIIVSRILDVEFIPTLVKRMNSISLDLHKNAFIVLINDIESSIYFLELLQCGFNDQIKTLLEINKSLSIDLFNQVFKSKLKNIIDTCFGKYVISESEYTVLKNTTASLKFNDKYTKLTDSVSGLTPKNKTNLESIILDFITSSIEHVILDLKFNYTGVLLLDQDIRNISNTFENRDKFIRIKSIVNVLSCEKDEIEGLKGGKRVKGVDVVKILKLRVDIDAEILKVIEK